MLVFVIGAVITAPYRGAGHGPGAQTSEGTGGSPAPSPVGVRRSAGTVVGPHVLAVVAGDVTLGPPLGGPLVAVVHHRLAAVVRRTGVPGEQAGAVAGTAATTTAAARAVVGPHTLAVVAGDVTLGPPLGGPVVADVGDLLAADVGGAGVPGRQGAATTAGTGRGRRRGTSAGRRR